MERAQYSGVWHIAVCGERNRSLFGAEHNKTKLKTKPKEETEESEEESEDELHFVNDSHQFG